MLLGQLPVALPAVAEVAVEKLHPGLGGRGLADLPGQFVFLLLADQQGSGEGVIFALSRHQGGLFQTLVITEAAALALPEGDPPEELLEIVAGGLDHFPRGSSRQLFHPFPPPEVLGEGMDIGVIKISVDLVPLSLQYLERIGGARPAADMEKDLHAEI